MFFSARSADVVAALEVLRTSTQGALADAQLKDRGGHYEHFIRVYHAETRQKKGVYYTNPRVAAEIVKEVDVCLRDVLGLEDGLASRATWGATSARFGVSIPHGVCASQAFVTIVDPAVGSGVFLIEVIKRVRKTVFESWSAQGLDDAAALERWTAYVAESLLPRLCGYEIMIAPWVSANLLLRSSLDDGWSPSADGGLRVDLVNALREPSTRGGGDPHHALRAGDRGTYFTVVLGNPPYRVASVNQGSFIGGLMRDYVDPVAEEQGRVALAGDYLKFFRLAQAMISASMLGVIALITPRRLLNGVVHRGARGVIRAQFSQLRVIDLHGDRAVGERAPGGVANANIFDIQQGVAITIAVKGGVEASPRYDEVWGTRAEKLVGIEGRRDWRVIEPKPPEHFFVPFDARRRAEYEKFTPLPALMPVRSCGLKTHRDRLLIDRDREALSQRFCDLAEGRVQKVRAEYEVRDTKHWTLSAAAQAVATKEVEKFITSVLYRPFDQRWIYYRPEIIEKGDAKYRVLRHMLTPDHRAVIDGEASNEKNNAAQNIALLAARIQSSEHFDAVYCTETLAEMKTAESSRSSSVFPLFLFLVGETQVNIDVPTLDGWRDASSLPRAVDGMLSVEGAWAFFDYVYAVLHSEAYRERYRAFLKIDFPRIPPLPRRDVFDLLRRLGGELRRCHTHPEARQVTVTARGKGAMEVQAFFYDGETLWLDVEKKRGFGPITEDVWRFKIGGYLVCKKWLGYRRKMALTSEEVDAFCAALSAIQETLRLRHAVDEVIARAGGWPRAFTANTTPARGAKNA